MFLVVRNENGPFITKISRWMLLVQIISAYEVLRASYKTC